MLNPETVVAATVTAIGTIQPLLDALGPDSPPPTLPRLSGFYYQFGSENPLAKTIGQMPEPGVLVVWKSTLPGAQDATQVWKHVLEIYIRSGNMVAALSANPGSSPTGPGYLWWLMMSQPVNGGPRNLRDVQIIPGRLLPMDIPSVSHRQDEIGLDYFVASVVLAEIFDDA